MKIATWNIERLKHRSRLPDIKEAIRNVDADILILTEADRTLKLPEYDFQLQTDDLESDDYDDTENRIIIYTSYQAIGGENTFDGKTSMCSFFVTPLGPLAVYGTIIGTHGNRGHQFNEDLAEQVLDFDGISKQVPVCIAGDFNMSFSDNYYYTKNGRETLSNCFEQNDLVNLTASLPECIDHIVVSKQFLGGREVKLTEWNLDKSLSDHKGVCAELIEAD
jgi:endonuclease/exonuclease/phosphatase family metal-dependent hydrolase